MSPVFRKFLTQAELTDRFGPSREAYEQVRDYLLINGFQLVEGSKNRMTLTVHGGRATAERAFDVKIGDYRIGEREFYANDRDPALPKLLASHVQSVSALSNYHSLERALLGAQCKDHGINENACISYCGALGGAIGYTTNGLIGTVIGLACALGAIYGEEYGILRWVGLRTSRSRPGGEIDGTGQKIGLVEFAAFHQSDVENFLALVNGAGMVAAPIENLSVAEVDGGATAGGLLYESEVLLDIDTVMARAPGAEVVVYQAPAIHGAGSFQSVLNKMIDDGVTVISNSWLYCEHQTTKADLASLDAIFQQAAASGISAFNASGDWGNSCYTGYPNSIAVPAGSPNATAVGGTSLTRGLGATYGSETWWDGSLDVPPGGQGGFGVSRFFDRPSYQNGLVTSSRRSVPDVAVNADPREGARICQGPLGCPTRGVFGGTSFAAPQWAAVAALVNQSLGENIGAFNQAIYPFANTEAFHDAASMSSDFAVVGDVEDERR
jgi:subtilase family serine protease